MFFFKSLKDERALGTESWFHFVVFLRSLTFSVGGISDFSGCLVMV